MKNNAYLGIDIGSISTKGVIIDEQNNILAYEYIMTDANPIKASKDLVRRLSTKFNYNKYKIVGVGTTGSARRLIGEMLGANIIKNEITAHAVGTITIHPDVRTILEIGGQDSKIILINNGVITDYAMNTLCAAGTGSFLSSQAKRLGININDFGKIALTSNNPVKIASRCTVFAESDLVHKAQIGYRTEDIVSGLCKAVVNNYLGNVAKGKKIYPKVVFQGGVSKNIGVVKAFKDELKMDIIVDDIGHLMGAFGIAILSKKKEKIDNFSFNMDNIKFEAKIKECSKCANNCEVVRIYKEEKLIDSWGNRCENGLK